GTTWGGLRAVEPHCTPDNRMTPGREIDFMPLRIDGRNGSFEGGPHASFRMNIRLTVVAFALFCTAAFAAEPPKWVPPPGALGEARERLHKGNYAEARAKYERLAKEDATRIPAAIGLSRGWRAEGDYAKAEANLTEALASAANNADLLAERADL